jgi:methionine aminotransferase
MNNEIPKPEGSYISYFSNLVKANGGINLAQGIPGFQPPEGLRQSLSSIVNNNVHQYAPGVGNFKLISLLQQNYSRYFEVEKENFLVVQGATEALSLIYTYLVQKLTRNFSVLSFDPAYESYSQLPKIFGQQFIGFPLDDNFSFNPSDFKDAITNNNVKVVFISSPGNPYGKIWSKKEVETLVDLAHTLNFYLIFDGVYKELYFDNPPYIPLEFKSPNIFYVNSFSKMLCITGWRVGYLYAHKEHRNGLRSIHDYIGLCAPSVLQEALAGYLENNDFGIDFVQGFRDDVKQNFNNLSKVLIELGFQIPLINGGCFIWSKLPSKFDSGFNFAHSLYQEVGVAIIPGEHFSANHKSWVRFNIARPAQEIQKAAELITQFLRNS